MRAGNEPQTKIRFPARADQLKQVRRLVRETAATQHWPSQIVDRIVLAVDEACTNIIRHAYGAEDTGDIILQISKSDDALTFRLTDFASPVDVSAVRPRPHDALRPGGLGLYFIREIMDEVQFMNHPRGVGNILEMKKKIAAQ